MLLDGAQLIAAGKTWLDAALSFFYPEVCQLCGKEQAGPRDGYVGTSCRNDVAWIKPPMCGRCGLPYRGEITTPFNCANCAGMDLFFSYARSAVEARGTILEIIHRFKYQRHLWFEPFLAELLTQAAASVITEEGWDMIVPVPLHRSREVEREFNQAERLARLLGKAVGLPVCRRALIRVKPTPSQTALSLAQRAENVRNAFTRHPKGATLVSGKRVIVVDDVLTTGATTNACAKVLRGIGAADVCVWTLARGLLN